MTNFNNYQHFNNFHIQGYIASTPQKRFTKTNKVVTYFNLLVMSYHHQLEIPLLMSGNLCEAFATMYDKGDEIEVDGTFIKMDEKIRLLVTKYRLIKKNTTQKNIVDKFQKVIELYSIERIKERENKNEK